MTLEKAVFEATFENRRKSVLERRARLERAYHEVESLCDPPRLDPQANLDAVMRRDRLQRAEGRSTVIPRRERARDARTCSTAVSCVMSSSLCSEVGATSSGVATISTPASSDPVQALVQRHSSHVERTIRVQSLDWRIAWRHSRNLSNAYRRTVCHEPGTVNRTQSCPRNKPTS